MTSPTRWTWVWVSSGSWWWTGKPGVLQSMRSQRVRHDWATELNWTPTQFTALSKLSKIYFGYWLYFLDDIAIPRKHKVDSNLMKDSGVSAQIYQCKCDGLYILCSLNTKICPILKILIPFLFKYPFQRSECLPIVTSLTLQSLFLS